jgi:O-antigen/teichoic acid export membrane protein
MKVDKADIFWSYTAQFFSIGTNILILPILLRYLSADEMGFYYILLAISSFVILFDFGFAPQFGRNITYVFAGAQKLSKEGIDTEENTSTINYNLLFSLINACKYLYVRLSIVILILMGSLGTVYIYNITNGFSSINNALLIWVIYSISVFFNMYYAYYSSLVNGRGMIAEHRKSIVYSKLAYTIIILLLITFNFGLLSVAIANLVAPFIARYVLYHYFFDKDIKSRWKKFKQTGESDSIETIKIIWYNAKKLGLVYIGTFALGQLGIIIAGWFLSFSEIASFGLMTQIVALLTVVASTVNTSYQARITFLKTKGEKSLMIREFAYTLAVFIMLFTSGAVIFVIIEQDILSMIGSKTMLPNRLLIIVYCIAVFLEKHYNIFTSYILLGNTVPFTKSVLISGVAVAVLIVSAFVYTEMRLWVLVLVPLIVQSIFNNWYWPSIVCNEFKLKYPELLRIGAHALINRLRKIDGNG